MDSEADDEEDAGRISKVAAAFSKWEDKIDDPNIGIKNYWESKKIGEEEDNVSKADKSLEAVENIGHGPVS